jgi:hypothetical protein
MAVVASNDFTSTLMSKIYPEWNEQSPFASLARPRNTEAMRLCLLPQPYYSPFSSQNFSGEESAQATEHLAALLRRTPSF